MFRTEEMYTQFRGVSFDGQNELKIPDVDHVGQSLARVMKSILFQSNIRRFQGDRIGVPVPYNRKHFYKNKNSFLKRNTFR